MLASELFKMMEQKVPLELAIKGDNVGFIGPGHPDEIEVEKAVVMLDIIHGCDLSHSEADLLVCHHPPLFPPKIPCYIIHSNWDIVEGGANDALVDSLKLESSNVLEEETGIGRICKLKCTLDQFKDRVFSSIDVDHIRIVKGGWDVIEEVAVISGFGLNPHYIKLASEKGADLLLSGDLTHEGSILAHKLGINLIDATHHATEFPGLKKLCQFITELGVETKLNHDCIPWEVCYSSRTR